MDLLQGQLSEGLLEQLSGQIGADRQQTQAATEGILSTMMGAMAKNASTTEGASALAGALDRDHDGSILDDVMGYLGGSVQAQNQKTMNGGGILNHILGNKQNGAVDMISQMSGLDSSKTGNLMTILAPMVMGALGRQKREQGLDAGGITDLLTNSVQTAGQQRQEMGIIGKFLDQDGDGSVIDDVAGMLFNRLFKR